jgi:uncharacterized membrane protein (UPF0127 family)
VQATAALVTAVLIVNCERSNAPAAGVGATTQAGQSTGGSQAPAEGLEGAPKRPDCMVPQQPEQPVAKPAASCPADPQGRFDLDTVEVVFVDLPGAPRILAEHAQSNPERTRGLMFRTDMPEDAGMLFSWEAAAPRSFWMKNTCLPLDMLFIDAQGFIVSILEQVPTLNTLPRRSGCPAQRVLEVNAGWTRAHGVRPGHRVEIR